MNTKHVSRIKSAELMSIVGAGFLGAGLALLLRERLGAFAVPILVGGLVAHTLGVYLKQALARRVDRRRSMRYRVLEIAADNYCVWSSVQTSPALRSSDRAEKLVLSYNGVHWLSRLPRQHP